MPTYDYICNACGHEFELFQSMTAPVKRKCPKCGKPKLERLIGTGAGIIFKGSGFYETDYRSESYKKAHEAETKAAAPDGKDGEASTEKKSAKVESKAAKNSTPSEPSMSKKRGNGAESAPPKRSKPE